MLRRGSTSLLFLTACAIELPELPSGPEQLPPEVSLRTPVVAPVERPVRFDASGSFDPNADPLTFVFEVNGVVVQRSASAVCEWTFAQSGLYTVTVRAIDLADNERVAVQDVTVITDYPDPPNFCDPGRRSLLCDECEAGVCYSTGGMLD